MRLMLLGLAVASFAGPVGAEVWKWRDDIGHLSYTNVTGTAPSLAKVLTGEIGFIGGKIEEPAPAEAPEAAVPPAERPPAPEAPLVAAPPYPYFPPYQWWWHDYQEDDPIATKLWLYKAEAVLQLRRWGFGS